MGSTNIILTILLVFITFITLYWIDFYKNKTRFLESIIFDLSFQHNELQKTLLTGIITRYRNYSEDNGEYKTPEDFEKLVAKILEKYYGGSVNTTKASGDFGIDLEHTYDSHLYLGQVKCYHTENKVNYEAIAILHSQMLKQKASGGYVITTSSFTNNAEEYASDLNIELIDGSKLVDMWLEVIQYDTKKAKQVLPQQA